MSGTRPAGEAQYGQTSMSSNPGRRPQARTLDTSVGNTATTVAANATVNAAANAQDTVLKAARVVANRRIGLARTNESGGAVAAVVIVAGGTGYTFTSPTANTPATGGSGVGAQLNVTRTAGVVTDVTIGASGGRGYAVDDLISATLAGGTGLSVRVTSVS